jgi:hypothetical protein
VDAVLIVGEAVVVCAVAAGMALVGHRLRRPDEFAHHLAIAGRARSGLARAAQRSPHGSRYHPPGSP